MLLLQESRRAFAGEIRWAQAEWRGAPWTLQSLFCSIVLLVLRLPRKRRILGERMPGLGSAKPSRSDARSARHLTSQQ
jgi:hypothetical protein